MILGTVKVKNRNNLMPSCRCKSRVPFLSLLCQKRHTRRQFHWCRFALKVVCRFCHFCVKNGIRGGNFIGADMPLRISPETAPFNGHRFGRGNDKTGIRVSGKVNQTYFKITPKPLVH